MGATISILGLPRFNSMIIEDKPVCARKAIAVSRTGSHRAFPFLLLRITQSLGSYSAKPNDFFTLQKLSLKGFPGLENK